MLLLNTVLLGLVFGKWLFCKGNGPYRIHGGYFSANHAAHHVQHQNCVPTIVFPD